jgi:hypothetical protein
VSTDAVREEFEKYIRQTLGNPETGLSRVSLDHILRRTADSFEYINDETQLRWKDWQAAYARGAAGAVALKERLAEVIAAEILAGDNRCPECRWMLAKTADAGCVLGNCSMRGGNSAEQSIRAARRTEWEWMTATVAKHLAALPSPPAAPQAEIDTLKEKP